ncbi:MAG: hypothetical protein K6G15_04235 [Desulfovibrio sp.]|nr:hypothetical protein [Desulfovibrio sp.]
MPRQTLSFSAARIAHAVQDLFKTRFLSLVKHTLSPFLPRQKQQTLGLGPKMPALLSFCLCFALTFCQIPAKALDLGQSLSVSESGVVLSDGYGGPLPSSYQLAQLGTLISHGFNQETSVLALLLQELGKKSLDSEALLTGLGKYFAALELLLKELQKNALTQEASYHDSRERLFGTTPFSCSDKLTAQAMHDAKKSMRQYTSELKRQRTSQGEGTQASEVSAEASVARLLLEIMRSEMTEGHPDEQKVPSATSLFPFSGVISSHGAKIFQAVISAVNSEPMPTIRNAESLSGRRALELQGIKMGRIAGIQEGLQIAFDLQNAVINGQAFSQMQAELNQEVQGKALAQDDYPEGAVNDQTGAISILKAISHEFETSRIASADWYQKIDHGAMTAEGLLRELIKMTAWRGYMDAQNLRINMVNAYNLAQLTAIMMERHDNARMINYVFPPGDDPTRAYHK